MEVEADEYALGSMILADVLGESLAAIGEGEETDDLSARDWHINHGPVQFNHGISYVNKVKAS